KEYNELQQTFLNLKHDFSIANYLGYQFIPNTLSFFEDGRVSAGKLAKISDIRVHDISLRVFPTNEIIQLWDNGLPQKARVKFKDEFAATTKTCLRFSGDVIVEFNRDGTASSVDSRNYEIFLLGTWRTINGLIQFDATGFIATEQNFLTAKAETY